MNNSVIDIDIREEILENDIGSIIVSASAGAGKTTIMIEKINTVLDAEKTHRTIAAITFTIKATKEIKERAQNNIAVKEIVVSTNDNFVEFEIIRPFISDTDLIHNFNGEFVVHYDAVLNTFDEGITRLKNEGILSSYKYELKKNFKFELAKVILEKSLAARQYIESKYFMMFIDEYQDSDTEMHELFMFIKKELRVKLFIVGDEKQAIYMWRGARKNIFKELTSRDFDKYVLTHNFRCHPQITNFANLIHHPEYFIESKEKITNIVLCKTALSRADCLKKLFLSGELDIKKETTVLINVNASAVKFCESAKEIGYDFLFIPKTPIDESLVNGFLLKQVAAFYFDSFFSIYDFCESLKIDNDYEAIKEYEKNLTPLNSKKKVKLEELQVIFKEFEKLFDIVVSNTEVQSLYDTLSDPAFEVCFRRNNSHLKVMTVFGSKGLEFDQVVAFAGDYDLLNEESRNKHYVAITRAKNKMVIIDNTHRYKKHLIKYVDDEKLQSDDQLRKVVKLIDL
ncbi:UvrD-helicase domain-containing protein [Exiguobacterium antarcticum]|uniref:UvrD-helicase domain-containing protein n=1 Tax=Exiguobacterium antarcticum TaxID=132920 RepID=UPI00055123D6|nr:UvrD-helicase domain-containing protein [Exiguobacterium antarcticum]